MSGAGAGPAPSAQVEEGTTSSPELFWLKVSRPGLWFQTLWLYTLPLAAGIEWRTLPFLLGAIYVTWPLNLLVYGWNDIVDYEIDRRNPRKDSWLFGARGSRAQLDRLPPMIIAAQVPFVAAAVALDGWRQLPLFLGIVAVNATYNARVGGLRGRPPFDLINPLGYLLIFQYSMWLNDSPAFPWQSAAYLALFCTHAQLMGEIMDYAPDRAAGRVTTATLIGVLPTKWLVIAMVIAEGALLGVVFGDWLLGGGLLLGAGWLIWDALIYARDRVYSRKEFTLLGLGMNAAGVASMGWVWIHGTLADTAL